MKHKELLRNEQACKNLTQEQQDQVISDLIEYLQTLEPADYEFHGKNEYGYQMSIAVDRGYGFCIDLCWNSESLWCYRDYGCVHPNLAKVSGDVYHTCIQKLKSTALKWCGVNQ
jgi:hypothetical protein